MLRGSLLAVAWLISPNVVQALAPVKELEALKSELRVQKQVLSNVEHQHEQTSERLKDKLVLEDRLQQQLLRLQQLNDQLTSAETEKVQVDQEAKQLMHAKDQSSMLLVDLSLEEELKKAQAARAEQQAAEMSGLSAQVKHFRSEVSQLQMNVASTRRLVQKTQQEEGSVLKAEQKESKEAALLQQKLDSRSKSAGALRAKAAAMTQQKKMLMKQTQLAQLNAQVDNGTMFLEKEKGALEAQRLHAEEENTEATRLTDALAQKEQQLQSDQRKLRGLGAELSRKVQSTESLQHQAGSLQGLVSKEQDGSREKMLALVQQIHEKDEKIDALKAEVFTHEANVKEVMSKIKSYMNRTKEMRHKAKAQVLLQETESKENASAISTQIEALKRSAEETERSFKMKLQQAEASEDAKQAETLREYQRQHSVAAAREHQIMVEARLQAQHRHNEQLHKKHRATQSRLATEIKQLKAESQHAVQESSEDLETVDKAISRVRASEAVKVAKVNQEMTVLMKSASELKKKFLETDAKVDEMMSAEASSAEKMKQVKLKVDDQETMYDAAKRRVENIYEDLRAGRRAHPAEVKRLSKALEAAKKHQARAVSLLSEKLKDVHQQVATAEAKMTQAQGDSLDAARESLEDLQAELTDSQAPELAVQTDPTVAKVLQEVEAASATSPAEV